MKRTEVYLSLGSNAGDRAENLAAGLAALSRTLGPYEALSRIIESEPWGFQSESKFLNCCVLYAISRDRPGARVLLEICKRIERAHGRDETPVSDPDGKRIYRDRTLDIDILFYGTERISEEGLVIPHPLIGERDFVKIPLREIASPELIRSFPEIFGKKI